MFFSRKFILLYNNRIKSLYIFKKKEEVYMYSRGKGGHFEGLRENFTFTSFEKNKLNKCK